MAVAPLKIHKAYPKPGCPNCGRYIKRAQMQSGPMRCAGCGTTFQAVVFAPPPESVTVRPLAAMGNSSGGIDGEGGAPCALHPLNAAGGVCERCGGFICALCRTELGGKGYCVGCFDRVLQTGNEEFGPERTRYDRGIARIAAVLGIIPFFGLVLGPLSFFYALRSIRQWRVGKPEAGGIAGLLLILLLAIADTAYNAAFVFWIVNSIARNVARGRL